MEAKRNLIGGYLDECESGLSSALLSPLSALSLFPSLYPLSMRSSPNPISVLSLIPSPIETSEQSILWPSDCLNTCNRQCPRPWQGIKLRRSLSPAFRLSDLALRSNERIKFIDLTLVPNLQTSKLI